MRRQLFSSGCLAALAALHRQLVKGDLASEYGNDIRVWLEALGPAAGG